MSGDAESKRYRAVFMAHRELGNVRRLQELAADKIMLVESLLEKALGEPDAAPK